VLALELGEVALVVGIELVMGSAWVRTLVQPGRPDETGVICWVIELKCAEDVSAIVARRPPSVSRCSLEEAPTP